MKQMKQFIRLKKCIYLYIYIYLYVCVCVCVCVCTDYFSHSCKIEAYLGSLLHLFYFFIFKLVLMQNSSGNLV